MNDTVAATSAPSNAEDTDVLSAILAPAPKLGQKSSAEAQPSPPAAKQAAPDTEAPEEEAAPEEPPGDEQFLEEEETPAEEEPAEAEIDPEEVEYEVKIDDTAVKVKLKDLKENYSGKIAVEKRIQEATERRAQAEQVGQALYNTLSEQAQRLTQLDEFLKETEPQVDWNRLRASDPQGYLIAKERQRDIHDRRQGVAQEQSRIQAEQNRLTEMANQAYSEDQARKLMDRLPELANPEKSKAVLDRLTNGAVEHYHFTSHEVAAVMDHRALLVLNDAIKYRELLARKASKGSSVNANLRSSSPTAVKTLLRPGNASPSGSEFSARMTAAKEEKAKMEKARQTGNVDDVANMLIIRAKKTG